MQKKLRQKWIFLIATILIFSMLVPAYALESPVPVDMESDMQTAAAPDYYINRDFEDIPEGYMRPQVGNWGLPAPNQYWHKDLGTGSAQVVYEPDADGKCLRLDGKLRIYHWLDDIPSSVKSNRFVVEWDTKVKNTDGVYGFGFSQQLFMYTGPETRGRILNSKDTIIPMDEWVHMAVDVNRQAGKYDLYFNHVKVVADMPIPSYGIAWNSFTIDVDSQHPMWLDNLRAYAGGYTKGQSAPPKNVWFLDTYDDVRSCEFPQVPGFLPFTNKYRFYYIDQISSHTYVSINPVPEYDNNTLRLGKALSAGQNESFKVFRYTDDHAQQINDPNLQYFTYEFDLYIYQHTGGHNWMFGFNDVDFYQINPFFTYEASWSHITMEVNKFANTYSVYVNGNPAIVNRPSPYNFTASNANISFFHIKSNYKENAFPGTIALDNLTGYAGRRRT